MKMKQFGRSEGFTLLEVLLVNAILAIVIGVIALMWQFILKNYTFSMDQYSLTTDTNYAVRKIETELRQTKEAMQGAYPLAILEDYQIAFYADMDQNGFVERLRYFVEDGDLTRGVIAPTGNPPNYDPLNEKMTIVARQVSVTHGPLFTYYNQNWPQDTINNPLPPSLRPLSTKLVRVMIPIEMRSDTGIATHSAEVIVHLRNLKNNL